MPVNNPLKNKIVALAETIDEMAFDVYFEFKEIEDSYDDLLEELEKLTESILPDAEIGRLDDEEREVLEENKEWAELNARFEYLDERYNIAKRIRDIIERAASDISDLT
tara:strand:- start:224 stop:550 length:327 start_codon:yes stop_codon:yes gene_type:complete